MNKNLKWWFFIAGASILIIYLMPQNINVSIRETLDRTQVAKIAHDFIISSGSSLQNYHPTVTRDPASDLIVYLNSRLEPKVFKKIVMSC